MPGFIRTKAQEKKWTRAKEAVMRNKNIKKESDITDQHWGLINSIYQKMEAKKK
jgi:hypothetical protein